MRSVVILYGQVSSVSAKSFYSPTMSWILISIEFLNMFPTKFFCFRDSVLPPRFPTVLTLWSNMFLASNFIGLILLATSQLFVPLVLGDRVSDALDSGKAVFIAFYVWWPGSVFSKQKCVTSKPCKNTECVYERTVFTRQFLRYYLSVFVPKTVLSRLIGLVHYITGGTRPEFGKSGLLIILLA